MATNYLGTSIGLIWDTLLPGIIPVTLYIAVQDRGHRGHHPWSALCAGSPPNTVVSSSWPATVLHERYCIFTEMQCHPGVFIVPEPAVHLCPVEGWTS